jgi:hypothetical protein
MPADDLDLDALGRREALTMDGRSLFHPPCVVLTVAERDALVARAREMRVTVVEFHGKPAHPHCQIEERCMLAEQPVRTCAGCRHWDRYDDEPENPHHECRATDRPADYMLTGEDFGCSLWQPTPQEGE